jgi:DNA-binding MarR family transcriptional regulator
LKNLSKFSTNMEHAELIIKTLKASGALRPGDIAEKAGLDKKDVEKVIKKLKDENKIFSPKRCFYDVK